MLNDEYFIGESVVSKMDEKNRIGLPKFTHKPIMSSNKEVAVQKKLVNNDLELRIFLASTYRKILNRYEEFLKNPNLSYEQYTEITTKIAAICAELDDIVKIDDQYRLLVSNSLISQSDWEHGDTFKIKGYGRYLSITKSLK